VAADNAPGRVEWAAVDVDHRSAERALWMLALLFYGVGDLVSTLVGLGLGASEGNPLPAILVGAVPGVLGPAVAVTAWKAAVMTGFVILARQLRPAHRLAVSGTLAALGVVVVAWNTTVLVSVYA